MIYIMFSFKDWSCSYKNSCTNVFKSKSTFPLFCIWWFHWRSWCYVFSWCSSTVHGTIYFWMLYYALTSYFKLFIINFFKECYCVVIATCHKIELEYNWYYEACPKCHKKVYEEGGKKACVSCDKTLNAVDPRYYIIYKN